MRIKKDNDRLKEVFNKLFVNGLMNYFNFKYLMLDKTVPDDIGKVIFRELTRRHMEMDYNDFVVGCAVLMG
jgi:hypothetical protein